MNSMTGFGRAELRKKDYSIQIELSSVNSRYLECIFRMPRLLAGVENKIKEILSSNLSRGKVTITVNLEESLIRSGGGMIDPDLVEAYYRQLKRLQKKLGVPGEVTMAQLVAHPEMLINPDKGLDEERLWPDLKKLLLKALNDLKKMRADEGHNLQRDMKKRIQYAKKLVTQIAKHAPENVSAYRTRLEKRIKDVGNGVQLDAQRLAEEVTVYADRSDISEECTRLNSHFALFKETLGNSGDAGKRLNFILQEMGREANTIGSKSIDPRTSRHAIPLKEQVEKLREQAQNIE